MQLSNGFALQFRYVHGSVHSRFSILGLEERVGERNRSVLEKIMTRHGKFRLKCSRRVQRAARVLLVQREVHFVVGERGQHSTPLAQGQECLHRGLHDKFERVLLCLHDEGIQLRLRSVKCLQQG